MKLAVIVDAFPHPREGLLLRELDFFLRAGVDLRIYHLAAWNHDHPLPGFARALAARSRYFPPFGPEARNATWRNRRLARRTAGRILRHQGRHERATVRALAGVGAALAVGEELRSWGCDHLHAAGAGDPATAAWIAHHVAGSPYSIACRERDIFEYRRLMVQTAGPAVTIRAHSDHGRRLVVERVPGLDRDRIEVIRDGVDIANIEPVPAPRKGPFRVLYVGGLSASDGVDVLLNALAGLDGDWTARIVGDGPERPALEVQARELGLDRGVRFLGQVDDASVAALYRGAHVVAAPSLVGPHGETDGIPPAMIEALAHGRPAISSNVSGTPELIRPGRTGWLTDPGDVVGLRRALDDVMHDPEAAERVAAQGRKHVVRTFDLDVNARRQLETFLRGGSPDRANAMAA